MHKMHKFCEYYSVFNHRMTWNHDWIQSWTTWKRPYVKKQFEKFFIFFMDISIHDSLSIHFKITWKSSFSLCFWTLFLGIQTSNMLPLYFLKNVLFRSNHIVTCLFLQVMALASYGGIWGREDSVYRCLPLSNWEQDENLPVETNQRHNIHWCQHFLCKDIPAVHYSLSRLFHGHSVKHSETLPLSSCWRSARCAL